MKVINIHERTFPIGAMKVGGLIDTLASQNDTLWPHEIWPRMKFDKPLKVGAVGGHQPIKYRIEEYVAGKFIKFRFLAPKGFKGFHTYEIVENDSGNTTLRHTIKMDAKGLALFTWPVLIRHLHDALLEDSLAKAEASLGKDPKVEPWSLWVKFLRWIMSGGKSRKQIAPNKAN